MRIEAVSALQSINKVTTPDSAANNVEAPIAIQDDVSRFNKFYRTNEEQFAGAPHDSAGYGPNEVSPSNKISDLEMSPDSWGHRIFKNIEQLELKHDKNLEQIDGYLTNPDFDAKSLFKLQFDLHRLTTEQLLVAKTAGKSVQNFDTLLKAQ